MNINKQDATVERREPADKGKPAVKNKWPRRLLMIGGGLLILVIVLVLLLPTLLSTGTGKGFIFGSVNKGLVGEVQVDDLSLGWFGGQRLSGLVVRGEDGTEIARVGLIELPRATLFGLLSGGLDIGETRIESVKADIVGYEDGTTNLQRALASRGGSAGGVTPTTAGGGSGGGVAAWPKGLSFDLVVRDVDIAYRAHGVTEPIRLNVMEADLSGADPTQLVFKLNAEVGRGDRTGAVAADAQVDGLFDGSGLYQPDAASAQVGAVVTDVPTDLLDTLFEQRGKLTALLGPVVNGDIKSEMSKAGGTAALSFVSERMDIDGGVAFSDDGVVGAGTSHIRLTVTPDAWALLSAAEGKPTSTLSGPVGVVVELSEFDLPINDAGLGLADARVDLKMTVGDASLTIDKVGVVELKDTSGMIRSDRVGSTLVSQFMTTSAVNGRPGGVGLDIELTDLIDDKQQLNISGLTAKVTGALTNAPVAAVLDELMPGTTHGLAARALGQTMDATLNVNASPRAEGVGVGGKFDLDLTTQGGETGLASKLVGRFNVDEEAVAADLAEGSHLAFTLTPGLMDAYQEAVGKTDGNDSAVVTAEDTSAGRVVLAQASDLRLDISEAFAHLQKDSDGAYALDMSSVRLDGRLASPRIKLNQQKKLAATLTGLLVDIQSAGLSGDTRVVMNAKIEYPATNVDDTPRPGLIESATNISELINTRGEIDAGAASYQTVTRIQQAPIDLIDALFEMDSELIAAVGPRARLDVVGSYSPAPGISPGVSSEAPEAPRASATGGFDVLLKSRTASADMKLLLDDGRWTLKADAPLSFQVTPRLSQRVLKKVNPFLGSAISAKLPIGVTVKQEGFAVPMQDPGIGDVNADINLELGKLDLRGEGQLKKLLEALGVGDRSLVNVGFSPVLISLAGGKLSYKDFTMSMGDVVLGFSGEVDLNNEKLDLKMTIPGSSLTHVKWLKGSIDPSQVIVVPLGGTFDRPTLDYKLLSGEIAKAALKGRLEDVAGEAIGDKIGGEAGAVVGGLLNDLITGKNPDPDAQEATSGVDESPATEITPPDDDTATTPDTTEPADEAGQDQTPTAKPELTAEERAARKERRRLRRERLEREQAERDKQAQ